MFNGIIRELKREDVPEVERIFDLYWSGDFRKRLTERVNNFIENPIHSEEDLSFVVAEEEGEVVGVAALRKAPDRMKIYSTTAKPIEFYVAAVKTKGRGIGKALRTHRVEEAKRRGYTEYSAL